MRVARIVTSVLAVAVLAYGVAAGWAWMNVRPAPLLTRHVTWYAVGDKWDPLAVFPEDHYCTRAAADAAARRSLAADPTDGLVNVYPTRVRAWRFGGARESIIAEFDGTHCQTQTRG